MFNTKKNKIILFIFLLIQSAIFYFFDLSISNFAILSVMSVVLLKSKFTKSMGKNIAIYFTEDQISWANEQDPLIKKFTNYAKKMNLDNVVFGYFQNDDINAYAFEDLNNKHTILISKEMKDYYNTQELDAVILHELGHLKFKHISYRMLISNACHVCLLSILTALFIKLTHQYNVLVSGLFIIVFSWPFIKIGSFISLMIDQYCSRQCEYEADATAIKIQGTPLHIMKVLTSIEQSKTSKNFWESFIQKIKYNEPDWLKTHPNIDKRLRHAESYIFKLKK